MDKDKLVERLLKGDQRAAARIITMIENNDPQKNSLMCEIYPHTGHAYIIGITGSPGAGKSSFTDKLVKEIRSAGLSVAIIAIDPTSPFSGGAILGDRIRMQSHSVDPEIFIRSMGTRGSLGGLSHATNEAVKVLDAMKKDIIIIETVGVGQSELDIMHLAHSTIVVLTPGAGDAIQTIKAGIMEIADIFVINKADLRDADRVQAEVEAMLDMKEESPWRPPVLQTISLTGAGVKEVWTKVLEHRTYIETSGILEQLQKKRLKEELREIVEHNLKKQILRFMEDLGEIDILVEKIFRRELDPYTVARNLMDAHFKVTPGENLQKD
ncbi:MAG: methylmalonyl Co-A mutase-associated GTPase MeaB [Dehalobacterium sp.]|jgi:LAO/AO transport system kinase